MKQSIRERLDELESERDQLVRALEALTAGGTANVGRRRGRPPGSGRASSRAGKRASGRRAPRGQRRQQVIDALSGGELGPSEIARQIGDVNPTQISGLLRHLASEGVVAKAASGKWALAGGSAPAVPGADAASGADGAAAVHEPASS